MVSQRISSGLVGAQDTLLKKRGGCWGLGVNPIRYQHLDSPPSLKLTAKAPKKGWLQYYFPIGMAYFQGRTVSFREGKSSPKNYEANKHGTTMLCSRELH